MLHRHIIIDDARFFKFIPLGNTRCDRCKLALISKHMAQINAQAEQRAVNRRQVRQKFRPVLYYVVYHSSTRLRYQFRIRVLLQVADMRPGADICAVGHIVNLFYPPVPEPLEHMSPVPLETDFDGRRCEKYNLLPVTQILHKCINIILIGSRTMRASADAGTTLDTFFLINIDY